MKNTKGSYEGKETQKKDNIDQKKTLMSRMEMKITAKGEERKKKGEEVRSK